MKKIVLKKYYANEGGFYMNEKFINFMKQNGYSDNTCEGYAREIRLFKNYYFDSYGEELTKLVHADISMYSSFLLRNNISPVTINRKIAAFKQYNLFLIAEGIQDDIVIVDRDYYKIQNSMIKKTLPTQKEINKLKHFTTQDTRNAKRDYCIITLFLYGGVRESELVTIRLVDIMLDERFVKILGKGNKLRQLVINDVMYNALVEYLSERNEIKTENPYLFLGQKNKKTREPLTRQFCNQLLDKYKEICDISILHPHLLRAYFCTNALHNAGYTIEQVANQAGQSSLNTTKKYLVNTTDDLLSLANKMP